MNSNYRQNSIYNQIKPSSSSLIFNKDFSDQGQGRNIQGTQDQQMRQGVMFSPKNNPYQLGNGMIPNIAQNQNQHQQNLPIQRGSHQSNQSANHSVNSQDQQMVQVFNNMMNFLIERGVVDSKQMHQMTPRSKYNLEQLYRQEQQNYFMQQMHSINDFYQQLNTQNNYDPQDYQQHPPRKGLSQQHTSIRYPFVNQQPFLQSGQKQQQLQDNDINYYLKNIQSPSSANNQNQFQQQYQQYQGMNMGNQILDNGSAISGEYNTNNNNSQLPNPMNYNMNNINLQQQQYNGNYNLGQEQYQQQQPNLWNGSPQHNNFVNNQNQNYYINKSLNTERKERSEDYIYSGQRVNTNPNQSIENEEIEKNQQRLQQQQYQQYLMQQMQQQQQQQQKQRRVLDYDEIFNLSSNQGDSLANTQNMGGTNYDDMQINTKYHQENLKATQTNGFQKEVNVDFDELPINSMGATRNFEELLENEMMKNNIPYEKKLSTEQDKLKKRGDTPQFREGSVGTTQKRNKTESPQRFLKQGEGKGGRTTSVVPKEKNSKKQVLKKTKQDSIDESLQFQKFEEILQEISTKKTDISTDDILKIQKEEMEILEIRGEKVRLDNIEIDENLERVLVTKYVNNKIQDLRYYIQKFQNSYQKARVFKQTYEENIKKFDLMKSNFEEKMLKEKSEFEDYKAEQKKLIEAEYRLLKKLQSEKLTQSALHQKGKETSSEREEDNTMKSLLRYKEEVKSLRDKLGRLQFDSKKKIEDLQLSLNNTIKENRKLRKEVNSQKKQLEQCEDLKYIVNPTTTIKEDPHEDQEKSSNERAQSADNKPEIVEIKKSNERPKGIPRNAKDAKKLQVRQVSPSSHTQIQKEKPEKKEESQEIQKQQNQKEVEKQVEQSQTITSRQSQGSSKKNHTLSENLKEQTSKLKSLINPKNNYKKSKQNEEEEQQQQKQQNQKQNQKPNENSDQKKNIPRQQPSSGTKNGANSTINNIQSSQINSSQDKQNIITKPVEKPIKKTPLNRYQTLQKFTIEEIGKNIEISEFEYNKNQYYIQYQQFVDKNKKAQHVENNKDGSVTSTYEKGIKETIYKNKTRQISFINGYQIVIFPTGDIKQVFPNNIEQYYFSSNKSTQTTLLEGQTVVLFTNNQIELTLSDGSKQIKYPEGMMKITDLNGEEKLIYPNGIIEIQDANKIKTIKYLDGTTKTVYPDNFIVKDEVKNQK